MVIAIVLPHFVYVVYCAFLQVNADSDRQIHSKITITYHEGLDTSFIHSYSSLLLSGNIISCQEDVKKYINILVKIGLAVGV